MSSLLEQALRYSERGAIFPLVPLEKRPLTANGYKDSSQDRQQIEAWWKQHPQANIGLDLGSLSNVWVLDIDRKENGTDGLKSLQNVKCEDGENVYQKIGQLDNLKGCTTPSGGQHLYFTSENEELTTQRHIGVWQGIDVLGANGYVILPPSKTNQGEYSAPKQFTLDKIPPAPEWLEQAVITAIHQKGRSTNYSMTSTSTAMKQGMKYTASVVCEWMDGVAEGERNVWLTKQIGRLLGQGMPVEYAYTWLHHLNSQFVEPSLADKEVNTVFKSILNKELEKREMGI
ncbi:bifunctional DNA primase/polymerase [Dolosigranulum pigrum]|uniref:bifunctional DNA primase/polymerase n=1 Tax=Dolosigranulum pigrum TaxID=29394 RepID=UPI00370D0D6F